MAYPLVHNRFLIRIHISLPQGDQLGGSWGREFHSFADEDAILVNLSATVRYLVLLDMSSNVEGCLLISVATSLKCIALKIPSRRFSLLSLSSSHSISLFSLVVLVVWSVRLMLFTVRTAQHQTH